MDSNINIAENHLRASEMKWFAVYTAYKREKIVAGMLAKKGIEVFLPLQKIRKQYIRKQKTVELPLFNCFVFVKITKREYVSVLETEHIVRFVKIGKNLLAIPENEIDIIKCIVGAQMQVETAALSLNGGDPIEVIAGGLSGLKGKFLQKDSKYNFLVELQIMGYGMRMQVKPEYLRKLKTYSSHLAGVEL